MVKSGVFLVCCLTFAVVSPGMAAEYVCPSPDAFHQEKPSDNHAGWTIRTREQPAPVNFIQFFDGDPSEEVSLAPQHHIQEGKDEVSIWPLEPVTPTDRPVWLACYAANERTFFARPLPLSVKECRVHYGPKNRVRRISCE
jgi:hypothetical protein